MKTTGTIEVIIKGLAFVIAALCTNLVSALAQWANSGEWPSKLQWIVIISTCGGGAMTALLSFMSGSYTDYQQKRDMNGTGNGLSTPQPAKQTNPTVGVGVGTK